MTAKITPIPWYQEDWQQIVDGRIKASLESLNYAVLADSEQVRVSAWSEVRRTLTDHGSVYMKTTAPVLNYEIGLTQQLEAWRPDLMPEVLEANKLEGWMLLADAGHTLRSRMKSPEDLRYWHSILPLYARFQQQMIPHQAKLMQLGILDRRLELLPVLFSNLLEDREMILIEQEDGLTKRQFQQLKSMIDFFEEGCAQLIELTIPYTIHHDDFHDGNIFLKDGRYTLADWGESCLTHPFFTLNVTLRSIAHRVNLPMDSPELDDLRDRYLDCWTDYGDIDMLRLAFDLAMILSTVNRALTWHHVLRGVDEDHRAEHIEAVTGWLAEFLATIV